MPSISPTTVVADRIVSKPYLEIHIDRQAISQYGISLQQVLDVIEFTIGGKRITTTVEGRERYPVRVRYTRELRDNLESLGRVLVPAQDGTQIPLMQMADIVYVRGLHVIKGENTFLVGYVLFDKLPGRAEVDVDGSDLAVFSSDFGKTDCTDGPIFTPAEYAGGYDDVNLAMVRDIRFGPSTGPFPAGADRVEVVLYYQGTSREYIEFLRDEINGSATAPNFLTLLPAAYIAQTDPFYQNLKAWGGTIWELWFHNHGLDGSGASVDGIVPFAMAQAVMVP